MCAINVMEKRKPEREYGVWWGCETELVVYEKCCPFKIRIDGYEIILESWLLVVTNLKTERYRE